MPDLPIWEHQRLRQNERAEAMIDDALAAEAEEMDPDPQPNRRSLRRPAEWFPQKPGSPGT